MQKKLDVHQIVTDQIIAAIERGAGNWEMPWHRPGSHFALPVNVESSKHYNGINILNLWIAAEIRERLEAISLLTEVLVEIRGRSDEQRLAIEHLAGQVTINTRAVEELEKAALAKPAAAGGQVPAELIRQIWLRAFLVSLVLTAIVAAGVVWMLRG